MKLIEQWVRWLHYILKEYFTPYPIISNTTPILSHRPIGVTAPAIYLVACWGLIAYHWHMYCAYIVAFTHSLMLSLADFDLSQK